MIAGESLKAEMDILSSIPGTVSNACRCLFRSLVSGIGYITTISA